MGNTHSSHRWGRWYKTRGLAPRDDIPTFDVTGRSLLESKTRTYTVYHGGALIGMGAAAGALLLISALLTGLILAICGLDIAWLKMRGITGDAKQRRQAHALMRLKRHGTWMLLSLILCSVAASEYFPFVIQGIWQDDRPWPPILICTLCIAVIGEILPQYIIPRHALTWGYWCEYLIWICMIITSPVSAPIAWLLDHFWTRRKEFNDSFTNEQIGSLIKYHERSEKNGGALGQDAARIMLGALKLDSRRIGGVSIPKDESCDGTDKDIEKAVPIVVNGLIVRWNVVKTVDINDQVDDAFIKKVKSWSYSRIPVIGRPRNSENRESIPSGDAWEGTKIFGFLHIKNLLCFGWERKEKEKGVVGLYHFVRDLPLYPLPIVREDMSVYELLDMFQHGMSRMAVVIPAPRMDTAAIAQQIANNIPSQSPLMPMVWSATETINSDAKSSKKGQKARIHDYLEAALTNADEHGHNLQSTLGIRSPKPVGIVTFGDIIDAILQKTSRDEKDFFDRNTSNPPTKSKKTGDYDSAATSIRYSQFISTGIAPAIPKRNTLRKRKGDKAVLNLDGADEYSLDSASTDPITEAKKYRKDFADSSYTHNSRGGFHGNDTSASVEDGSVMTADQIMAMANVSSSDLPDSSYSIAKTQPASSRGDNSDRTEKSDRTVSLPSRKVLSDRVMNSPRRASAVPRLPQLPQLRRVTPFSRQHYSSYEKMDGNAAELASDLVMPIPDTTPGAPTGENNRSCSIPSVAETAKYLRGEDSGHTVIISSFRGDGANGDEAESVYDAFPNPAPRACCDICKENPSAHETRPYSGFPPELLETEIKENRAPDYASSTMPRMADPAAIMGSETHIRDVSFHDDRAMLPSQRRLLDSVDIGNARSTSFWL